MEKFLDLAYRRDSEAPRSWPFRSLTCTSAAGLSPMQTVMADAAPVAPPFYPASQFTLHGRTPLPWPEQEPRPRPVNRFDPPPLAPTPAPRLPAPPAAATPLRRRLCSMSASTGSVWSVSTTCAGRTPPVRMRRAGDPRLAVRVARAFARHTSAGGGVIRAKTTPVSPFPAPSSSTRLPANFSGCRAIRSQRKRPASQRADPVPPVAWAPNPERSLSDTSASATAAGKSCAFARVRGEIAASQTLRGAQNLSRRRGKRCDSGRAQAPLLPAP